MDRPGEASSSATATSNLIGSGDQASPDHQNVWEGSIFLSHSGHQKPFVTELYRALLCARYRPFYDLDIRDSLPLGLDYPSRIFEACRGCRVAIVVLSEKFITSFWPMLELQLLLHPASSVARIYPLFYELSPGELAHSRWKEFWETNIKVWQDKMRHVQESMSFNGCGIEINLDMSSFAENLRKLQYTSGIQLQGKISHVNKQTLHSRTEGTCILEVLSNLRGDFPPPPRPLERGIEGGERLHEEIIKVFEKEESLGADGVRAVGVHGIGGSGKSTLCQIMVTFYAKEFDERCYHLRFPSDVNEVEKLLQDIRTNILPTLGLLASSGHDITNVTNIDKAMDLLAEGLQRSKIFLAMDNVWEHSSDGDTFDYAKKTMLMKFMQGSKILVTSRQKELLRDLLQSRLEGPGNYASMNRECSIKQAVSTVIVQVPSLNEMEAVKALKFYSSYSSPHLIPDEDEWRRLARSCFFGATQCHPLYLKLMGAEIKTTGRVWFSDQQWKDLFSRLISANRHPPNFRIVEEVDRAVEKSFNKLHVDLQNIFIDLATAWDLLNGLIDSLAAISLWDVLCYFTDIRDCTTDDMYQNVLKLEYHALLEIKIVNENRVGDVQTIEIHDLHRSFAKSRVSNDDRHANALIHHVLNIRGDNLSGISSLEVASKKYVPGKIFSLRKWETLLGKLPRHAPPSQTRVLRLSGGKMSAMSTGSVKLNKGGFMNLKALRVLELSNTEGIRKIGGWEGIPNLMRLELIYLSDLRRIRALGCLKKLETLWIEDCKNLKVQVLVGGHRGHYWKKKSSLVQVGDCLPKLKVLCFKRNKHLVELGSTFSDTFPDLKKLILEKCKGLERLPNLDKLGSLRALVLRCCYNLKFISADQEGICSLPASLQQLDLTKCEQLERLPDLNTLLDLRRLDTAGCNSSMRLNLARSACEHLELLSLPEANYNIDIDDDGWSAGTITFDSLVANMALRDKNDLIPNPFTNLRTLQLGSLADSLLLPVSDYPDTSTSTKMTWQLDVSGLPSLQELRLYKSLNWVQKLSIISLLNLTDLFIHEFPILEEITCQLGAESIAAVSLSSLKIMACPSLVDVSGLAALTSLTYLSIEHCPALADVSALATLTSLMYLYISNCPALADVSALVALTSLASLTLLTRTS